MKNDEEYQKLATEFNKLCDEQERLYKPEFEEVFKVLSQLDSSLTKDYPCTKDEALLDKALKAAKHSADEVFCADFKRYNLLFVEGKELQRRGLELIAVNLPEQKEIVVEGWHFEPIEIACSSNLSSVVEGVMAKDADEGKGLFANVTEIPNEDESLDEFLCVEAYGLKCSFLPFYDELRRFGVVGGGNPFLSMELTPGLFAFLKDSASYLKIHTDSPLAVRNKIADMIKRLDGVPHWGLFLQILFLQGLCRLLEGVNINEGDDGYAEGCNLLDWLSERLVEKEVAFCYKPYGDGDLERLKPLCDYLMNTDVGRVVQDTLFRKEPQQDEEGGCLLPSELDTDEAHKYFDKAKELGLIDDDYKWLKGQQLLSCFCHDMSRKLGLGKGDRISWEPFELLFGIKKGKMRSNYNDIQKIGQEPSDIGLVESVFE